ncbi:hypothetical protein NG819_08320 [Pseudarthrobacter sp. Fe7]|nr:hypothetical protein NG819_08320 [Pseudarthrobacter sp. Fe7]
MSQREVFTHWQVLTKVERVIVRMGAGGVREGGLRITADRYQKTNDHYVEGPS